MSIHLKRENVVERKRVHTGEHGQGSMVVKKVYGNECSLMIAVRAPGYHSKPHFHESDQLIHVLEGEMWFFVEEQGFHCKKGDFLRIPANKIQWDWNRSDGDVVVVEAHAPALIGGPSGEGAIGLFGDGEEYKIKDPAKNTFVNYDSALVERRYNSV